MTIKMKGGTEKNNNKGKNEGLYNEQEQILDNNKQ